MIITDDEVQSSKNKMASRMNNMMEKCNAQVVYIGPDKSILGKHMNKNVSNFTAMIFLIVFKAGLIQQIMPLRAVVFQQITAIKYSTDPIHHSFIRINFSNSLLYL
jgi:hypothetical protein